METGFRSGRNCSGLGGAAAGIESIVSVVELPVQHRLQKCSLASNRSQGQQTMLKMEDLDEAVAVSVLSRTLIQVPDFVH